MPDLAPEQRARQQIDAQLAACGWVVQDYKAVRFLRRPRHRAARSAAQVRPLRLPAARRSQGGRRHRGQEGRHHAVRRRRAIGALRREPARLPRRRLSRRAAVPLRIHRRRNLLPRRARSRLRARAASSRSIAPKRSPTGSPSRDTLRARLQAMPSAHPLATHRHARLPDRSHHRPRKILRRRPSARADPHGHRRGQDLHRLRLHLPPDQIRQGAPRPVPRRPRQSRRAGHATNSTASSRPTPAASSPSSTTSSI